MWRLCIFLCIQYSYSSIIISNVSLKAINRETAANDEQEEKETATTLDLPAYIFTTRTIQEWTIKLGDKKCCRLANERDLQKSIGCQSLPELSSFSVCTDSTLPPHVTLAVDSVLLEREGTLMLKYGCLGDAVEMKVEDYLVLAKECVVTVRTVEF